MRLRQGVQISTYNGLTNIQTAKQTKRKYCFGHSAVQRAIAHTHSHTRTYIHLGRTVANAKVHVEYKCFK